CAPAVDTTPPAIVHAPVPNGQQAGVDVVVTAFATDASGVASFELYYRAVGGGAFTPVSLASLGGDAYSGTIPGGPVAVAGVEYYLRAIDAASPANAKTDPAGGETAPYSFMVTTQDTAGPAILHRPVTSDQTAGQAVAISARVVDQSGVQSVRL